MVIKVFIVLAVTGVILGGGNALIAGNVKNLRSLCFSVFCPGIANGNSRVAKSGTKHLCLSQGSNFYVHHARQIN